MRGAGPRLLLYFGKPSSKLADAIGRVLESYGVSYDVAHGRLSEDQLEGFDLVVVVGEDRDVLTVSHAMRERVVPVLGLSVSGNSTFLMEAGVGEVESVVEKLGAGEYHVAEVSRLSVSLDGSSEGVPCALNEVAVFPSRSATLMEHTLVVDDEVVWRDYSDGVIVATPTGSTAYALSAGGPILLPSSKAFVVVSVNSLDLTRRPLVVSEDSVIEIREVSSRCDCEVVVDGSHRFKVEDRVVIRRAERPALFVRLSRGSDTARRIAKKVMLAKELMDMPPSAKLILKILEYEGPLTQKDIIAKTLLPPRTVRHALSILMSRGLVHKQPLLRDARQDLYYVATELE